MRRVLLTVKHTLVIALFIVVPCQTTFAQYSEANAVNNAGRIAGGICVNGCAGLEAFLWRRGAFQTFDTFGGFAGVAFGINDAGEAVGQADTNEVDPDAGGAFVSRAFLVDRAGVVHNRFLIIVAHPFSFARCG